MERPYARRNNSSKEDEKLWNLMPLCYNFFWNTFAYYFVCIIYIFYHFKCMYKEPQISFSLNCSFLMIFNGNLSKLEADWLHPLSISAEKLFCEYNIYRSREEYENVINIFCHDCCESKLVKKPRLSVQFWKY